MPDDLSGNASNATQDADELFARGDALLDVLSREAEAARAEARRAELEQVLADARRLRNATQLQVWLDAYNRAPRDLSSQSSSETLLAPLQQARSPCHPATSPAADNLPEVLRQSEIAPASAPFCHAATEAAGVTEKANVAAGGTVPNSWDTYLPAARQRLELRAQLLRDGADFAAVCSRMPLLRMLPKVMKNDSSAATTTEAGETLSPHNTSPPERRETASHKARALRSSPLDAHPATPGNTRAALDRVTTVGTSQSSHAIAPRKIDRLSVGASAASGKPQSAKSIPAKPRSDELQLTKPLLSKPKTATSGGRPETRQARKTRAVSDGQRRQESRQQLPWQLVFVRSRGLGVSLAFHAALAILLALMTLRLPLPPASLAFESSVSDTLETFELSEPLEVISPPDAPESLSTPTPAIDASESLPEISNKLVSSTLKGIASPTARLASAAMAAANAGSIRASVMSSDSSFFGAAAPGNYFCYVIDSSGSMRGGAWESAKSELLRSLASLKPNQRFYIIFFNTELQAIPLPGEREPASSALYASPENLQHARRWIDSVKIDKGASPLAALRLAIDLEPDAVYLLTDGVTSVDVPKAVREFNRVQDLINGEQVKAPIHAIAYYSLKGEQLMKRLAAENNGQFIYVPAPRRPTR